MLLYRYKIDSFSDPAHQDIGNIENFLLGQCPSLGDAVPFAQTVPAAACGSVLSDEARVSVPRRLFTVVFRVSRSESLAYKFHTVLADHLFASVAAIVDHSLIQFKSASEFGFSQAFF